MTTLLCPHTVENLLIKEQRPLREIRAARLAIDNMIARNAKWGFKTVIRSLNDGLDIAEVWRFHNDSGFYEDAGYTVRLSYYMNDINDTIKDYLFTFFDNGNTEIFHREWT